MDERLEEIKRRNENDCLFREDIDYIIQQAERAWGAEHLLTNIYTHRNELATKVQELELDRNDWKDEAGKWNRRYHTSEESHLETMEFLDSTSNQYKRLKEALEFYADEKNYDRPYDNEDYFDYLPSEMDFDKGEKARQALKGESRG